jgi:hypothetical protein
VILYNPRNGREIRSFFAYDHDYHGGVQTVGLDRENDDADALIVAPLDGVADIHRYEPRDPENTILALSPFNGFVTDYTGGAVVAAGRLGSSRTDSIAVANTGDRQATVNMYTATGGTLLDTVYPFGSYVGPVTIASGWVY